MKSDLVLWGLPAVVLAVRRTNSDAHRAVRTLNLAQVKGDEDAGIMPEEGDPAVEEDPEGHLGLMKTSIDLRDPYHPKHHPRVPHAVIEKIVAENKQKTDPVNSSSNGSCNVMKTVTAF